MSVESAARFVSRANGVARQTSFPFTPIGVLQRGVLLALQLKEVSYGEIFRLEPTQENVVIFLGAHQMNVAIGGQPVFLAAGCDGFEFHHDTARLFCLERKLLDDRFVEETAIHFQPIILGSREIKRRSTFEQDEMRFILCRNLERFRLVAAVPDTFAVKHVGAQRQVAFYRAEPERLVRLKQINTCRNNLSRVGALDYDFQMRRKIRSQRLAYLGEAYQQCETQKQH